SPACRSPKAGRGILGTVDDLPFFLQAEALQPFISPELRESTKPIFYQTQTGKSVGYNAEVLPRVCETYLKYRDRCLLETKKIPSGYRDIFTACEILIWGLERATQSDVKRW